MMIVAGAMTEAMLGDIAVRQSQLAGRLDAILESRRQREPALRSSIHQIEYGLDQIRSNESKRLIGLTDGTANTAAHMSESIRRLDREQSRILDVLQLLGRVERIHELVGMIGGSGVEQACQIVHDLEQFSPVSIAAYQTRYPSELGLSVYVVGVKKALVAKISERINEVLGRPSFVPADLASLFHLLGLIDSVKEGVLQYSAFLNAQCKESIDSLIAGLDSAHTLPYASALSRLLDHSTRTLKWTLSMGPLADHRQIIYEPFLGIVQESIESLVEKFLGTIGLAEDSGPTHIFQLDLVISELSLMCSHLCSFEERINELIFPDIYQDSYDPVLLLERYRSLELCYLRLGLEKAIQLDTGVELVSSSVDDAFFLVRKVMFRAISTNGPILAIARLVKDILQSQFAISGSRSLVHSSDSLDKKKTACRAANNLVASSELTSRLIEELSEALMEREECVQVIEMFGECQKHFAEAAEKALESIYKGLVKVKMTSLVSVTLTAPPSAVEDDPVSRFTLKYSTVISEVSPLLIDENLALLTRLIASDLVSSSSKHILKLKPFNQPVAVQLDKQIRTVVAFLTDAGGMQARKVLTPLLRIGEVLVSDNQAEAEEILSTAVDVDRRILNLRIDYLN